jgi:hypothetical protein
LISSPMEGRVAGGTQVLLKKVAIDVAYRLSATVSSFAPLPGYGRVTISNPLYLYTFELFADHLSRQRDHVAGEIKHVCNRSRRPYR